MHIDLSTSNSGAPAFSLFAFGPVTPTGLGVGYQTFPDELALSVSSYMGDAETFGGHVRDVMEEFRRHLAPKHH